MATRRTRSTQREREIEPTRDLPKIHDEASEEIREEAADEMCGSCGKPMALKQGRFGQFLACTGYPECKTTRKIQKDGTISAPDVMLEEPCPHCARHLIIKQGRYGPFTACSNYPTCRYIKKETTGVGCPECGVGELVVKQSKRGPFYGCGSYPACKFTLRDKPIAQACPRCGSRFLIEKATRNFGRFLECRNDGCDFREELPEVAGEPAREGQRPVA